MTIVIVLVILACCGAILYKCCCCGTSCLPNLSGCCTYEQCCCGCCPDNDIEEEEDIYADQPIPASHASNPTGWRQLGTLPLSYDTDSTLSNIYNVPHTLTDPQFQKTQTAAAIPFPEHLRAPPPSRAASLAALNAEEMEATGIGARPTY